MSVRSAVSRYARTTFEYVYDDIKHQPSAGSAQDVKNGLCSLKKMGLEVPAQRARERALKPACGILPVTHSATLVILSLIAANLTDTVHYK